MQISRHLISRLSEFVRSETGLYFPESRWDDLWRGLRAAARDLAFKDIESFANRLLSFACTKEERDILIDHLTTGETFFFRDKDLFQVLRDNVLAEYARKHQSVRKSLKIWSAGCCRGEEPYSIAILIDQMRPVFNGWELTIMATDINSRFLRKAKEGIYTKWSLRTTPKLILNTYFTHKGPNRFEISSKIKEMVTFHRFNLAGNEFPEFLDHTHFDLILCRNVLMYFSPETISRVIAKLYNTLSYGGWLRVSPSESMFVERSGLELVRFPLTSLYRKSQAKNNSVLQIRESVHKPRRKLLLMDQKAIPALPEKVSSTPKRDIYQEAFHLYKNKQYEQCVQELRRFLSYNNDNSDVSPQKSQAMLLLVKAMANMGKLAEAETWCRKAIDMEKMNPHLRLLLSTILDERNCSEESIEALKQAIYLDPEFAMAHFQLGNIAAKIKDRDLSIKHLRNARQLLESVNPEDPVPGSEGMTAGELLGLITGIGESLKQLNYHQFSV